ncbi:hypothetical protein DFH09DRAFT_1099067 [Mycena vulgaris]|nr:hypothetical protein DFH09DRAFT_1099067 [Mycena vulgaris]
MGPVEGGKSPKRAGKGVLGRARIWAVGSQYSQEEEQGPAGAAIWAPQRAENPQNELADGGPSLATMDRLDRLLLQIIIDAWNLSFPRSSSGSYGRKALYMPAGMMRNGRNVLSALYFSVYLRCMVRGSKATAFQPGFGLSKHKAGPKAISGQHFGLPLALVTKPKSRGFLVSGQSQSITK